MVGELEFEKPIVRVKKKIADLKELRRNREVDLTSEIEKLEIRLEKLEKDIYKNIKPWDRVQIARHPNRPTTLDYISRLFTDFFECHGDRTFGDDEAIVGGIAKFGSCNGYWSSTRKRYEGKYSPKLWNATSRRISKSTSLNETSG